MRITESKLRSIVRSVIRESGYGEENYGDIGLSRDVDPDYTQVHMQLPPHLHNLKSLIDDYAHTKHRDDRGVVMGEIEHLARSKGLKIDDVKSVLDLKYPSGERVYPTSVVDRIMSGARYAMLTPAEEKFLKALDFEMSIKQDGKKNFMNDPRWEGAHDRVVELGRALQSSGKNVEDLVNWAVRTGDWRSISKWGDDQTGSAVLDYLDEESQPVYSGKGMDFDTEVDTLLSFASDIELAMESGDAEEEEEAADAALAKAGEITGAFGKDRLEAALRSKISRMRGAGDVGLTYVLNNLR